VSAIEVKRLSPEIADDFIAFFEGGAFNDNPHWASCYCYFNHFPYSDHWSARKAEVNRAAKLELIRTGRAHGVLAYLGGHPIGWCHAAPRAELAHGGYKDMPDSAQGGVTVCYVIDPKHRRQGVATLLLHEAVDMLRDMGMTFVEAHPLKELPTGDARLSAEARSYHGTLAMYLGAGFEKVREDGDFMTVRRTLSPPALRAASPRSGEGNGPAARRT
jgi:GNAT superfamily N-acetyltransferase